MYTNIRRYTVQKSNKKDLEVVFFESESGNQPARDFIKSLTKEEKRIIGADVRIVQNSFPIGLPLVRKLRPKLWEIRSDLKDGINRVFFTFINEKIILLHGIVKKTQKTPPKEINVATERIKEYKRLQK
jgi:phage-related protein